MIEIKGLSKKLDFQPILTDLNLCLKEGEFGVVLGASGSGKTTLLRCISGLEKIDDGQILFNGVPHSDKVKIGFVFQNLGLFPHLSVEENIELGLASEMKRHASQQVDELLQLCQIVHLRKRKPDQISGGEKQRVALARALASQPSLILLDEPFSSLDPHLRSEVRGQVKDILKKAGLTALMVTHDLAEAYSLADKIGVLEKGKIIQWDSPRNSYLYPKTMSAAKFLGPCSFLELEVKKSGRFGIGETEFPLNAEQFQSAPPLLLIRPENIQQATKGFSAEVLEIKFQGLYNEILLRNEQGQNLLYSCSPNINFDKGKIYFFDWKIETAVLYYEEKQIALVRMSDGSI